MKEFCFKSILLCFCLLLDFNAFAYDAEIGGIYYNFSGDEATVTMNYFGYSYEGSVIIPESVTYEGKTYSVTSIGLSAFDGCSGLTSITIPNSVTSIGSKAFYICSGLTSVSIPNGVTNIGSDAFSGCSGLTSIVVESTNTVFDSRNDCNAIIETATNTLVAGCKNTIIPSSVTSIGYSAFYGCSGLTSITIPNSVTSIGNSAFAYCKSLTSITIGNSVTSIGGSAFDRCIRLTSVHITDLAAWCKILFGDYYSNPLTLAYHLYMNGQEIKDLVIPNSVTNIGSYAFSGCSGLTSVTIPNSVTNIGDDAFSGCSGLTSVIIGHGVENIGKRAFDNCNALTAVHISDLTAWCNITFSYSSLSYVYLNIRDNNVYDSNPLYYACHLYMNGTEIKDLIIPEEVTKISDGAFYGCSSLTSLTIGNNVTSIGSYAFYRCSGLTSVTIGNDVTNIGDLAFCRCSSLTSVNIPNSVTSIGSGVFAYCGGLTSITIPSSVTRIDDSAFINCSGLTSITIPNSVTSIGDYAFISCSGLTSITIPNSVTSIGSSAFSGCSGLTSVSIGNSVTSIGNSAFSDCSGLTSITIPNSVTSIGSSAFYNCSGLTSITIPNSVTSIGGSAFKNCKLRNLLVKCVAPPSIGTDAFSEQTLYHTTLYVPVGCWDAYAYDNTWYKFHNIRETATTEEEVSAELAFMLMDAEKFTYSVYDPVNDQINTINSVGINEDNPNHSWQMIEAGGAHFLYNIGAKKYVKRNGTRLEMTDVPEPIDVENGENGLVLGAQTAQQWALVSNEHMNVAQSAIDEVTGISDLNATVSNSPIYNLAGQRLSKMQKGINIRNGKKVLVK